MNAIAHIRNNQRNIQWSKVVNHLLSCNDSPGANRILAETGLTQDQLQMIARGWRPKKIEKEKLKLLAGRYIAIGNLLECGFDWDDIDDMCLIVDCSQDKIRRISNPIRVFSDMKGISTGN